MWVVVGLGNPGARYHGTRHNVGFRVVDRLATRRAVDVSKAEDQALVGTACRLDARVWLMKPQTYMNASGEGVESLRRVYRFALNRLLVVHDDVDLPVGRVRIRAGGGAGGHQGIVSLIDALGDSEFLRVKVGVGRPPAGTDTAEYVLAVPSAIEVQALEDAESRAADAIELVLADGPAQAMNRINQKEGSHGGPPL